MRIRYIAVVMPMILATFLVSVMAGCATLGIGSANMISLEDEWELGRQLEAEIAREMDLVNDRQALEYINQVGQRIVRQTNMRDLPWKFHIVNDPAINAFNIPGGHVYVNTGLIEAANNASELAGVMAHEIAHGVERHGTERLTKAYELNIIAALVLGQDPGMIE